MTGTLNALVAAAVLFVGGHFLLSSTALRAQLVRSLGAQHFRGLYSLVVLAAFVWLLLAYREAPFLAIWEPPPALRWVPLLVMPLACLLMVCGLTTRSPTMVGGEELTRDAPASLDPVPGILRITRHPFLWAVTLWSASHLLVKGDAGNLILMGALLVLAAGGMGHIDQRRAAAMGSGWGPIAMTTSALPLVALATRRTTMDWAGIGWWRLAASLAVYALLLYLHPAIFGVSPLP